jgi:RND family efflux transporter MFP subunit
MKPKQIALFIFIAITAFSAGIWYRASTNGGAKASLSDPIVAHYICPMHPQYISDKPGNCPSCGMQLVASYKPDDSNEQAERRGTQLPPGTIYISPEGQHLIGLRTVQVGRSSGTWLLRSLGRVVADETRLFVINATVDGWITSAGRASQGNFVKKDEVLAAFYSPEFLSATQAVLFALGSMDRAQVTGMERPAQKDRIAQFNIDLRQYEDSLRNLGMGRLQIQRLIETRQSSENVDITSPSDGIVLERKVSEGLRFNKGDEMYRIADLSRVWILLDVFEYEEAYLRPGVQVQITRPGRHTTFTARVADALPQFDPVSRTLKVRLEASNPGLLLRPDMFVDIELPVRYQESFVVPAEAILDSGLKTTIFVDQGNGFIARRPVETGWRMGGLVEITRGLVTGERIVSSGNFLIDSESRLQLTAVGLPKDHIVEPASTSRTLPELSKDLVCGMDVGPNNPGTTKADYQGKTYYFCTAKCRESFLREPDKYLHSEHAKANRPSM